MHLLCVVYYFFAVALTTVDPLATSTEKPYILDTSSSQLHYDYTADYYWSAIHDDLEDVETQGNHETVNGPFGFGLAAGLTSLNSQCLKKEDFISPNEKCVISPGLCADGLSFSIWVKPILEGDLNSSSDAPDETLFRYIFSTGGDTDGHPGVAVWQQKLWTSAVVSTGERYWLIRVFGAVQSNVWNNIGVVWSKNESDGMVMYVNLTKVGQMEDWKSAVPKLGNIPPLLTVGCHRNHATGQYGGFSDMEVDELAFWKTALTNVSVVWLTGGFQENHSLINVEEFLSMISKVELTKPEQQQAAVSLLEKLTVLRVDPDDDQPPSEAAASSSVLNVTIAPNYNVIITTPTFDSESVEELSNVIKALLVMLNEEKLPKNISKEQASEYMKVSRVLGNLLERKRKDAWLGLQELTDQGGPLRLVHRFATYKSELYKQVFFPNGSEPMCQESNTANILSESCKMNLGRLKKRPMVVIPEYNKGYLRRFKENWNSPYDRVALPTRLFQDSMCDARPVSVHTELFDTVSEFAEVIVNAAVLNPNALYRVDSRVLSFNVITDSPLNPDNDGEIDTSEPLCTPDQEVFDKDPLRIVLEHKRKVRSLRKLLFHEDEVVTDVSSRRCVWWNADLSDNGAWDTTGCTALQSSEEKTMCACNKFGTFAILAERVNPIIVQEDPDWLLQVKYIFYGVSAVALILYVIVILISGGDLRDEFHLMGLNLAVAILGGSMSMVSSDFDEIRSDRHSCVAFGTLLHFFYTGVGTWMLALGYASFKAITAGIIGGRLKAYMSICWGSAVACTGVPYVGYLRHLGTDPRCFIGWSNDVKLTFFVPQVICAVVALFYAIVIMCNLSTPALRKENLIDDYGSFCRGAALLLILLSTTWIFGLFAYVNLGVNFPDFYPIFQVLNSLAGLTLFICIGLGSNRFRLLIAGQAKERRKMLKSHAFGLPPAAPTTREEDS